MPFPELQLLRLERLKVQGSHSVCASDTTLGLGLGKGILHGKYSRTTGSRSHASWLRFGAMQAMPGKCTGAGSCQQTRNSLGEELCSTIQLAHSTLLDGDPEAMLELFPTQLACPQSWSPRAMCILQVLVDGICFNVVLFGARLLIESSGPCNILNLAATSHVHTNGRHRDLLVVAVWLCSLR